MITYFLTVIFVKKGIKKFKKKAIKYFFSW